MNVNLKSGDLLYRQKGIFGHAGVYLGNMMVFHHSPDSGAEVVSFANYAAGKEVKIVISDSHNREVLVAALKRILASDPVYNPLTNNCEHLANALLFGRKFSGQAQAVLLSAVAGGLISWKIGKGNPFLVAITAGSIGCIGVNLFRKTHGKVVVA